MTMAKSVTVFQPHFMELLGGRYVWTDGVCPTLAVRGSNNRPVVVYEETDDGQDGDGLQPGDDAPIRGSCVD